MHRIGKVLSASNVIACLALFVALGGSVYAAGKINGKQIKPNSIPGNRVKANSLAGNRVKAGTLGGGRIKSESITGTQVKNGSLTGAQIEDGSITGTQVDTSTLTSVTASKLSGIQYASSTVPFVAFVVAANATATCPPGTSVVGGGAAVSDDELAYVNDSGPTGTHNGWTASGFGEPPASMTVTAICVATG